MLDLAKFGPAIAVGGRKERDGACGFYYTTKSGHLLLTSVLSGIFQKALAAEESFFVSDLHLGLIMRFFHSLAIVEIER